MKASSQEEIAECLREVRGIYADLQNRPVKRDCRLRAGCCHFKITGLVPQLTAGEALLAAKALRATGRTKLPERADGACPMLDSESRCLIYADRPFGCRTHFCAAAGGPFSRREVVDLIRRLEAVAARLGSDQPRSLPAAVRRALRDLPPSRLAKRTS